MKTRFRIAASLALVLGAGARSAAAQAADPVARSTDAACVDGRISSIDIEALPIGPPEGDQEGVVGWGFRMVNHLHVRTTRGFIRSQLLFGEGDCFDPIRATDSQRILEAYSFIADARVVARDDSVGGKRMLVQTRDQWSTKGDIGVTYDEGLNLESFRFTELNFLGRGMFVELAHRQRLEQKSRSLGLNVPNLFLRTGASLNMSSTPDGRAFSEGIGHGFAGDAGRFSAREVFSAYPALFSWATDGAEPFSHVLQAARGRSLELAAAGRVGPPTASVIVGASFTRQWYVPETAEVAYHGAFGDRTAPPGPISAAIARQDGGWASTRVALHLGFRHYRYVSWEGLDAVRDRQTVGYGVFVGGTVGRTMPLLVPDAAPAQRDVFGRVHMSWGAGAGPALLHGGVTLEGRHADGRWKDVLGEGEAVVYARGLPGQTLFGRASFSGGWRTELPFQLTLGGREGVRALGNDRFPGGRQMLFVLEDRLRFPKMPQNAFDLGATLFADLGRMWPGDVPYGRDSGWQAAAGFGLRLAFPAGTRNVWRPDIVFPVGPGAQGSPFFRVTFELNRMRSGFYNPDLWRSRRFSRGPDSF